MTVSEISLQLASAFCGGSDCNALILVVLDARRGRRGRVGEGTVELLKDPCPVPHQAGPYNRGPYARGPGKLPSMTDCMGRTGVYGKHPRSLSCHTQTFIHREEPFAQDVAAATEFHPEPAVRGGEGLGDFTATKPA